MVEGYVWASAENGTMPGLTSRFGVQLVEWNGAQAWTDNCCPQNEVGPSGIMTVIFGERSALRLIPSEVVPWLFRADAGR